ncbi:MAG: hypothetical protein ABUL64_02625, partial [Singulisphaera sp.]
MRLIETGTAVALACLILSAGCRRGVENGQVTGTVTYKGKPVVGANLMFVSPSGRPGAATTDERGHFEAQTVLPGDGVRAGEQVVVLSARYTPPHDLRTKKKEGKLTA